MILQGKNAIVTGARKGIGRAIVEAFAQNGANIWACARQYDTNFEMEMASLAEQYGVWIKPTYFNLADEEAIRVGTKEILKDKQSIDILVNNAGIPYGAFLQMTPIQAMKDIFAVNFYAPMILMQTFSRMMMRQKSGSIINIVSVEGLIGNAGYSAYGSSKAALSFATRSVSKELASYGIRVNAIAPGLTDTEMGAQMEPGAKEATIQACSMKRLGHPTEIAQAVVFLASNNASFVNGQILRVDGGM